MEDVIGRVINKLVRRHPHVFEDDGPKLETAEEVSQQWDALKSKEPGRDSITNGLPPGMPALAYAAALQRRAGRAGLPVPDGGAKDLTEAIAGRELFEAVARIQVSGIDPEVALRAAALRYRDRIKRTEMLAGDDGSLADLETNVRDDLWDQASSG
jgi:XTP/dITP diphosphohydrolase